MANSDLASFVLLFNNFQGTDDVEALSENARYQLHPPSHDETAFWRGQGSSKCLGPLFGLRFGEYMYSPMGWTLGSSNQEDVCDFQLATSNQTGVGTKAINVDVEPFTNRARIKVLSHNPVRVHVEQNRPKRKRIVTLEQGQSLDIDETVVIDLGLVTFRAWRPLLPAELEAEYRRNVKQFNEDVLAAIPRLPLNLDSNGASTLTMRFGKDNACYKVDDPTQTRWGGFASVHKVRELRSKKVFAAKEPYYHINESPATSRKHLEALTGEFELQSKVPHVRSRILFRFGRISLTQSQPNVVAVREIIPGKLPFDPAWLIMEWFEHDLGSYQLDLADNPRLFLDIIGGLAFMHDKHYVHRDLKPPNILLRINQHRLTVAKIADFGSSKLDRSGQMRTYIGTNAYMAPEFWYKEIKYDKAIDMWSVGVIFLQRLITWNIDEEAWNTALPPTKKHHDKWIADVLKRRVPAAPELYQEMLFGLLSKDARKRWKARRTEEFLHSHMMSQTCETQEIDAQRSIASADDRNLDLLAPSSVAKDSLPSIAGPSTIR